MFLAAACGFAQTFHPTNAQLEAGAQVGCRGEGRGQGVEVYRNSWADIVSDVRVVVAHTPLSLAERSGNDARTDFRPCPKARMLQKYRGALVLEAVYESWTEEASAHIAIAQGEWYYKPHHERQTIPEPSTSLYSSRVTWMHSVIAAFRIDAPKSASSRQPARIIVRRADSGAEVKFDLHWTQLAGSHPSP